MRELMVLFHNEVDLASLAGVVVVGGTSATANSCATAFSCTLPESGDPVIWPVRREVVSIEQWDWRLEEGGRGSHVRPISESVSGGAVHRVVGRYPI